MTGVELVVVWNGTAGAVYGEELLPPRAERSSLPVDRDREADREDRRLDRATWEPDPLGRRCQCGCGRTLPKRARRHGQSIRFCHGHHRRGQTSPLKGRTRS